MNGNKMIDVKSDKPVCLGDEGFDLLKKGDQILYKVKVDTNFTLAEIVDDPGTTGVFIKLIEDYNGKNIQYHSGEIIVAGAREIYSVKT